jgi:hypothetical protein
MKTLIIATGTFFIGAGLSALIFSTLLTDARDNTAKSLAQTRSCLDTEQRWEKAVADWKFVADKYETTSELWRAIARREKYLADTYKTSSEQWEHNHNMCMELLQIK